MNRRQNSDRTFTFETEHEYNEEEGKHQYKLATMVAVALATIFILGTAWGFILGIIWLTRVVL